MTDDWQPDDNFAATVRSVAPWVAVGVAATFFASAWVGRGRAAAEVEKARLSIECAKNPGTVWKDDHCERLPELP